MSTQLWERTAPHIPVMALGWSLGSFLALTFASCVVFGLVEAFVYGWLVAPIFGPLFNYFSTRGKYVSPAHTPQAKE